MEHSSRFTKHIELSAIADQLSALADGLRGGSEINLAETVSKDDRSQSTFLQLAKQTYADRRKRDGILGDAQLLGEPAWDILLDLYIAQAQGQEVSVSSACIGSAAPPTTGLRWLGVLQEEGLVERINDPSDQRRVLVHLTPFGLDKMDAYFAEVASAKASTQSGGRAHSSLAAEKSAILMNNFSPS